MACSFGRSWRRRASRRSSRRKRRRKRRRGSSGRPRRARCPFVCSYNPRGGPWRPASLASGALAGGDSQRVDGQGEAQDPAPAQPRAPPRGPRKGLRPTCPREHPTNKATTFLSRPNQGFPPTSFVTRLEPRRNVSTSRATQSVALLHNSPPDLKPVLASAELEQPPYSRTRPWPAVRAAAERGHGGRDREPPRLSGARRPTRSWP